LIVDQTLDYVVAFDAAVGQSSSKEELVERVTAKYGDPALPMIKGAIDQLRSERRCLLKEGVRFIH